MKKIRGLLIISLLITYLFINSIFAADIIYIVKNPKRVDNVYLNVFKELNLDVKIIDDSDIDDIEFSKYKFIFIGDGKLKNKKYIPDNYPIVVTGHYYAKYSGFLKKGRVSKVAANSNMNVEKDGKEIEVYSSSSYGLGGVGISYYYIPQKFKNDNIESIAMASIGSRYNHGDVIAYMKNPKKCFFGIYKTNYWTDDSRDLFIDCIKYVSDQEIMIPDRNDSNTTGNETDSNDTKPGVNETKPDNNTLPDSNETYDNQTQEDNNTIGKIHDVKIDDQYINSVNGIRIRDSELGTYLVNDSILQCFRKYRIDYKTVNIGDYIENVTFNGTIASFYWHSKSDNLEPRESTTAGSKTINVTVNPGNYEIKVNAIIKNDASPQNNIKTRNVKVKCDGY